MTGGSNDKAKIGAFMRDGDVAPPRMVAMNYLMSKGVQSAREKRNQHRLGHIELKFRHYRQSSKVERMSLATLIKLGMTKAVSSAKARRSAWPLVSE
eukprot:7598041-Heterocapsa_arctica.AAC.1